jgi:hypothetical protein
VDQFKVVSAIFQGQDLIVGNLGDSRAVLGTRNQNGLLVAHQLTVDLKPDHPSNSLDFLNSNCIIFILFSRGYLFVTVYSVMLLG